MNEREMAFLDIADVALVKVMQMLDPPTVRTQGADEPKTVSNVVYDAIMKVREAQEMLATRVP